MTKKVYIFSGLGADESVFQFLEFSDCDVTFIQWIEPLQKETIEAYANRIKKQITSSNPVLIGLSFGGIMAIEVAKLIETHKVILIASAKTKFEIPYYFRLAGKLKLHKLIPAALLKKSNPITEYFFGTTSSYDKKLLTTILRNTNPVFLKWAIDKIVNWENLSTSVDIFHIHGNKDRILPHRFIKCNATIKDGGHLMTLNQAPIINKLLKQVL